MSKIRYAEVEDFDTISTLWSNNLGEMSPLKNGVNDIYDLILSGDILICDEGFCHYSSNKKDDSIVLHGIVGNNFEEYITYLSEMNSNLIIDCLSTSALSKYCEEKFTTAKTFISKSDRLQHKLFTLSNIQIDNEEEKSDIRVLKCRFRNEEDLQEFATRNNITLSRDVAWYDVRLNQYGFSYHSPKSELKDGYWEEEWWGMPKFEPYNSNVSEPYATIDFRFDGYDNEYLSKFFNCKITDRTKSKWYPELELGEYSGYRVLGGDSKTRYPIYVVSKNRSTRCFTSQILTKMEVPHYVVVEPDDFDLYTEHVKSAYAEIIQLDMSYKERYDCFDDYGLTRSTGPGPARNFCWDDSISKGFKWHWVFDDNAGDGFYYVYQNKKLRCHTGAIFRACEDFVDRYDNLAIAGLNYYSFYPKDTIRPAFTLNSRIYSFLLIRNDIPYRWRGRYNEDTDISLRVLKDGWCTVDFNAFLAGKVTTQRVPGGNTEEFYAREGTLPKSKMLQDMHPDVARVSWKFGRWHHEVDYSRFTQRLHLRDEYVKNNNPNSYGMVIVPTKEHDGYVYSKSELEEKYKTLFEYFSGKDVQETVFRCKY